MFAYIKGKLTKAQPAIAVIETGGMGYKIFIAASTYVQLPALGADCLLHTSLVIRENSQNIYGFLSEEEREFFEAVIGLSGIGPKTALSLIGHLSIDEIRQGVANQDIAQFCRVPGIGKKTAERLIIEMRDKMAKPSKSFQADFAIPVQNDVQGQKIMDAINALIHLGYNQASAQKAVKNSLGNLPEQFGLPELITHALKHV